MRIAVEALVEFLVFFLKYLWVEISLKEIVPDASKASDICEKAVFYVIAEVTSCKKLTWMMNAIINRVT